VLDALGAGLRVTVLEDAIAGTNPEDSSGALAEMRAKGAEFIGGGEPEPGEPSP
jgi:nicotinamidase-related amidase